MTGRIAFRCRRRPSSRVAVAALLGVSALALAPALVRAQVVTDGTMGAATTLTGPAYAISSDLGTQRGGNLFHSFSTFSVPAGGSATFSGPSSVTRVIGRVTGGGASSIDGKLASSISGADVYLINPAGVVFGANATLSVSGNFHASTASEIRFPDGATFDAARPAASTLSVESPSAFGFTGAPKAVTVNGATLNGASGKTVSLSGGDVTIKGGNVSVDLGRINLTAAGAGAAMTVSDGAVTIKGGTVSVSDGARVSTRGNGGGTIAIRGGALAVSGAARVRADTTGAKNNSGGVTVDATSVLVSDRGQISANTESSGAAGTVDVTTDYLKIMGDGLTVQTLVMARSTAVATGDAGKVKVKADKVELRFGGNITASSLGRGNAGSVEITGGDILLSHDSSGAGTGTGIFSLASATDGGAAGSVTVSGRSLELYGGAQISTRSGGSGQAGVINVNVNSIVLSGHAGPDSSQIASQNTAGTSGDAGSISITAKTITVADGAHITSKTRGGGRGGSISITADSILLSTGYPDIDSGISGGATDTATGSGGEIVINAGSLTINSGAAVSTATASAGDAGTIKITAGTLSIDGAAAAAGTSTGVLSSAKGASAGAGGAVTVNAGSIEIANAGAISASAEGRGAAGNISVSASDAIYLRGGVISTSTLNSDGGNISVSAGSLIYASRGQITTSVSGGAGDGGNITVSRPLVVASNDSTMLANAFGGNGGNITILAGNVVSSAGTRVDASSSLGVSGLVSIEAPVNELSGSIAPLSSEFVDPSRLLRASCADRAPGAASSSLSGGGRGGMRATPDGFLLPALADSPLYDARVAALASLGDGVTPRCAR